MFAKCTVLDALPIHILTVTACDCPRMPISLEYYRDFRRGTIKQKK